MTATDTRDVTAGYEMVVGLEVHVQLKTRTKAFCRCSTDFGAPPNTNVCPVCLAMPGALPVLNEHAVELAVRAALALECTVHSVSIFARKNYFYPDLPKGYQISQFDRPLATGGRLRIGTRDDGTALVVGITRVHMEEDAGKSIHDRYAGASAIDLNRSGVPLIEIVSEPDMRSAAEAREYLQALKQLLEYVDVSDVSMEEGSLRVDANVSARRRGVRTLGTKTEVKNMNSFSGVERALEAEFARQCVVLEAGGRVEQQTMLWDGAAGAVRPARSKEASHDYRYFPEPDLPPLVLDRKTIDRAREQLPELPAARRARFAAEYGLGAYDVEVLTATSRLAEYFEQVARASEDAKASANWVQGEVLAALKASGEPIDRFRVRPADLAELLTLVRDGVLSHTAAKQVFAVMQRTGERAPHLETIPGEVYEAARVDGASGWRAYRGITLPLLRPALLVAAVLNLIYVFNSFPIVWTLNDRNPGFAHDTMITYMYKIAFKSALRDVGLAAALGVVNVALILIAVLAYLKVAWVREEPA